MRICIFFILEDTLQHIIKTCLHHELTSSSLLRNKSSSLRTNTLSCNTPFLQVNTYLKNHDTNGLDIQIMIPVHAMRLTCERAIEGKVTTTHTWTNLPYEYIDAFCFIIHLPLRRIFVYTPPLPHVQLSRSLTHLD